MIHLLFVFCFSVTLTFPSSIYIHFYTLNIIIGITIAYTFSQLKLLFSFYDVLNYALRLLFPLPRTHTWKHSTVDCFYLVSVNTALKNSIANGYRNRAIIKWSSFKYAFSWTFFKDETISLLLYSSLRKHSNKDLYIIMISL